MNKVHFLVLNMNKNVERLNNISKNLKNKVKYCNNTLYLNEANIWHNDVNYINDWLLHYILKSDIYKMKKDIQTAYAQNLKNAKNVREITMTKSNSTNHSHTFICL